MERERGPRGTEDSRTASLRQDSLDTYSVPSESSLTSGATALSLQDYCKQVFHLCDVEGKGYITREEIARFCDRRNSVLDSVMASLDVDNDGTISFEEFQAGFQAFEDLPSESPRDDPSHSSTPVAHPSPHNFTDGFLTDEEVFESDPSASEDSAAWRSIAERIDPDNLLKGTEAERVWRQLCHRDPALMEQFEGFLVDVVEELRKNEFDKQTLESHMKKVMDQHKSDVNEMEEMLAQHISEVTLDHRAKNATKTKRLSNQFQGLLEEREAVIAKLSAEETTLKKALEDKAQSALFLKQERERLLSENQVLKEQLDTSQQQLNLSRKAVARLSTHDLSQVGLSPPSETEYLELVPDVDDANPTSSPTYFPPKKSPAHNKSDRAGGNGEHAPTVAKRLFSGEEMEKGEGEGGMSQEEEEERIIPGGREEREPASRPVNISWHDPRTPPKQYDSNHVTTPPSHVTSPSSPSSNRDPSPLHDLTNNMLSYSSQVTGSTARGMQTDASLTISSWIPRSDNLRRPTSPTAISRIFKVAFLGNSGVGKTSLIRRLSEGQFSIPGSTLGLDFTTKTLKIGDERVVFQLWDTAGQERFHNALTPVYLRRADAFVIVYDVTCRNSFLNTKSWLSIVTAALRERPTVLMLVGNKSDRTAERDVSLEEGRRRALELHALFSEMSALSGDNVLTAHTTLASLLVARENETIDKARKAALQLTDEEKGKRKCFC